MNRNIPGPVGPISAPSFNDRASITEVTLPTLGIPYYLPDKSLLFPSGNIRISAMTVAEEKMMTQKNADPSKKMCQLLARVCELKGMKAENLLVADQFFLLLKVRSLSYGNVYGFQQRCDDCGHQWRHELNLETDLTLNMADEEWQEPFSVDLPVSGKNVKYRLLRAVDEIELNTKKIRRDAPNEDPTFVSILARCIVAVDDQ